MCTLVCVCVCVCAPFHQHAHIVMMKKNLFACRIFHPHIHTHTQTVVDWFQNEISSNASRWAALVYVGKAFSSSPKNYFMCFALLLYIKHCKHFRGRCILQLISRAEFSIVGIVRDVESIFRDISSSRGQAYRKKSGEKYFTAEENISVCFSYQLKTKVGKFSTESSNRILVRKEKRANSISRSWKDRVYWLSVFAIVISWNKESLKENKRLFPFEWHRRECRGWRKINSWKIKRRKKNVIKVRLANRECEAWRNNWKIHKVKSCENIS